MKGFLLDLTQALKILQIFNCLNQLQTIHSLFPILINQKIHDLLIEFYRKILSPVVKNTVWTVLFGSKLLRNFGELKKT
jgi:hypothetical protein